MTGLLLDAARAAVIHATSRVLDVLFAGRLFLVWLTDREAT